MRILILVLTFLAAGACILAAACAVALRLPPRAIRAVLPVAARLLESARQQAKRLYGTGVRL